MSFVLLNPPMDLCHDIHFFEVVFRCMLSCVNPCRICLNGTMLQQQELIKGWKLCHKYRLNQSSISVHWNNTFSVTSFSTTPFFVQSFDHLTATINNCVNLVADEACWDAPSSSNSNKLLMALLISKLCKWTWSHMNNYKEEIQAWEE